MERRRPTPVPSDRGLHLMTLIDNWPAFQLVLEVSAYHTRQQQLRTALRPQKVNPLTSCQS